MNRAIKKISLILILITMSVLMIRYNIVSNATEVLNVEATEDSANLVSQVEETNIENSQSTEGVLENASAIEGAYGNELVNISENVSAIDNVETEYTVTTEASTDTIVTTINTYLDTYVNNPDGSEADSVGADIEDWLKENIYTLPGIASVKYNKSLTPYNEDAIINFPHNSSEKRNMNDYVDFSNSTWYEHSPSLKYNPTIFKEVYDNYEGESNSDISTQVAYSNYNAKRIYPYWWYQAKELKNLDNHYDTQYSDAHRIPYILAFLEKGTEDFTASPTDVQKALWGATGTTEYQTENLYKASKAVEYFLNKEVKEDKHDTDLEIRLPEGAQVGTVYSVTTADLDAMYEAIGGAGFVGEAQPEITFDQTAKVKVGPFVMGDYAYAISECVEEFSGTIKGTETKIEWPSIIAGIVGGEITLENGVVMEIGTTAKICYTDWYNNVPFDYVKQEFGIDAGDVRGQLRGSEDNYIRQPELKGTYTSNNQWKDKGARTKTSMGEQPTQVFDLGVTINEGGKQVDYPFPLPYSTFYIEIPVSACGDGNVLQSISFDYRTTEVTGTGDVIIVRAAKTTTSFSETKNYNIIQGIIGSEETIEDPCTTYWHSQGCHCDGGHYSSNCHACNCTNNHNHDCQHKCTSSCTDGYECVHDEEDHDCKEEGCGDLSDHDCEEDGCPKEECSHVCSVWYGCYYDCDCDDGHYWNDSIGGINCDGTCDCDGHSTTEYCELNGTWAYCEHGHRDCERGYWETEIGPDGGEIENGTAYGQPIVRIDKANVKVGTYKYTKTVNVRLFSHIARSAKIVFVWHGWSEGFTYEGNDDFSGFFDFSDLSFDDPKPAELGDRVTYKVSYENKTNESYYIYVRANYPSDVSANSTTDVKVKTIDLFDKGSALINEFFNFDIDTTFIKPDANNMQEIVNPGASRTGSAKVLLEGGKTVNFFVQFIFTIDWKINPKTNNYYSLVADITSRDGKEKSTPYSSLSTTNFAKEPWLNNIDFVRTKHEGDPRHLGPVMTKVQWYPDEPKHKEYTVNINKYIYDVNHASGNSLYTMSSSEERGINSDASITNNTLTYDQLKEKHDEQEPLKQQSPVYVEYGDRVTYKIELSNTKIIDREEDPYYEPDKVYVTLVDELPLKYSDFDYTIESIGEEGTEEQKEHLQITEPPEDNVAGTTKQKFILKDIMIPKNGTTTITINLTVEEHTKGTVEQNRAYIDTNEGVYNFNRGDLKERRALEVCTITNHTKITGDSSDWYKLNDYKVDIDKYISSYRSRVHDDNEDANLTHETPIIGKAGLSTFFEDGKMVTGTKQSVNEDTRRKGMTNTDKSNDPVQAEKTDDLIYTIKLQNLTKETSNSFVGGKKNRTAVRVSKVIEEIDQGLDVKEVKAYIYYNSGTRKRDITQYLHVTPAISDGITKYEFTLDHVYNTLLMQNEYVVFYVRVSVSESNMSLAKLTNKATLAVLTNINAPDTTDANSPSEDGRVVKEEKNGGYNENTITNSSSTEYVRMKDLVISGKVWLDKDRDGKMEAEDLSLLTAKEKELYKANGAMAGKAGVEVRLYKEGQTTPLRVTYTDGNGEYTFSKKSDGGWYTNSFESSGNTGVSKDGKTYQRVDKANKDAYGNYINSPDSYINYYIEFVYDGVLYKSTELYSRNDYSELDRADQGMTNLTGNGNYNGNYISDSNAAEKDDVRSNFNTKYQYISYNTAFTEGNNVNPGGSLEFDKIGHTSLLKENPERAMIARTFINDETNADNYLWLYKGNGTGGPNTEYLKYINLGLELREEVDISLTKDVYKVKTTINGESMEYNFNENYALNGVGAGLGGTNPTDADNEYLNDFIIAKPYGLELYESDYKYRVDQYFADKVIEYKGIESELNVEVTYRITVDNKPISDDDEVLKTKDYVTNEPLNVKVNEIMDVYEDNFIKYGAKTNNEITVKTKTEEGTLDKLIVKTIEAWYYKDVGAGNGNYRRIVEETETQKPIYEEYAGGGYERVDLTVSDTSIFKDNTVNYSSYGYNKLYITGMGGETISENDDLDIYVKYTLDKEKATLEQNNTNYSETISEKTTEYTSATLGDAYATYQKTMEVDTTNSTVVMERSLKIMESVLRDKSIERGIENIAQVNAYSVWYADGSPASLVDRNSNAGNLINPDNIATFEDTTYKTGIVIVAEGTGWDKEEVLTKIDENIEFKGSPDLKRIIDGVVWDDVRNDTLGSGAETQYVGDGLKNDILQTNEDLMNENVEINYRPTDNIKEDKDFGIRNIKAEFIEIVKIPDPTSETGERYYEQVLEEVTWQQVQNDRTDIDGKYELEGFIPGTYIVRFTYGDVVKENEGKEGDAFDPTIQAQNDMIIFNGQDYKSTTAQVINETEMDDIIDKLEIEGGSDARDDERRRLEVNSYSEIMTNPKAEILKGTGNGALRTNADGTTESITTNTEKNSRTELKTLVDNTYMYADTIEFLVKPEKLTNDQITDREDLRKVLLGNDYKVSYEDLMDLLRKETNERTFRISNIDFGIEYRPESEIRLVKEIEEVKLITENGETLVDLYFLTKGEGNDTKHEIDKTRSKGVELVQFVTNDYNVLLNKLTNEEKQGFVFVQVDEEILQGCTVQIIYKFEAENNSEVDRIAVSLDKIRYKENQAAKDLLEKYEKARILALTNYTASGIAAKVVETDMYKIEEGPQKLEYRIRPKTMVEEGMTEEQIKQAYYGKYVGYGYYTGEESSLDTIASLKFDKILDYVDVNLEYKQESEQVATLDKFWTRVKTEDLKTLLYPVRSKLETNPGNPVEELQNGRGYTYDTLLVSVDDRIKDDKYSTKYSSFTINEEADNIRNNSLSRFLLPKDTVVDKTDAEELSKAVATIRLPVSKVLSAETDKNDMSYENMAEIVQFTTLTGRRTNFATTIGNADIESIIPDEGIGTLEFVTATLESDTAATETVTLIPPTGLMRNRRAIVNIVEATSVGVGFIFVLGTVAVILIVIITVILFVIRKYKKRRII